MLGMSPLEKMVKSLEDMGADKGLVEALKLDIANEKLESLNAQLSVGEIQMRVMKVHAEERLRLIAEDTAYFKEQNMLTEDLQILTKQHIEDEQEKIDIVNEELAIIAQIKVLEAQILTMKKEGAGIEPPVPPVEVISALQKIKDAYDEVNEASKKTTASIAVSAAKQGSAMLNTGKAMEQAAQQAVQAEIQKAVASQIAKIRTKVPFPFNIALAAAGGAAVGSLMTGAVREFKKIGAAATGADFVTSGKQMLMVGDNPSGREHVQVTPLGGDPAPNAPSRGNNITLNISAPLVDDTVVDHIIPALNEAIRRGETLNSA